MSCSPTSGSSTGEKDLVNVTIDWSRVSPGETKNGMISIASNGGGSSVSVTAARPADPPICVLSRASINFGDVLVNECSDETFTIKNDGGGTLIGSVYEFCDHFSIVSGSGNYNLGPGQSLTVTVRFAPTSTGSKYCEVSTGSACPNLPCTGEALGTAEYIVHLGVDKTWTSFWDYGDCDFGWSDAGRSSCVEARPIGAAQSTVDATPFFGGDAWAWVQVGKEFQVRQSCTSGTSEQATITITCEYNGKIWGGGAFGHAKARLDAVVKDLSAGEWSNNVFDKIRTQGSEDISGVASKPVPLTLRSDLYI